jgi:hypothetical protein
MRHSRKQQGVTCYSQEEYNDQLEDIREEIENKYGKLTACVLPRPSPRGPEHDNPGVGLAFVSFEVRHRALDPEPDRTSRTSLGMG